MFGLLCGVLLPGLVLGGSPEIGAQAKTGDVYTYRAVFHAGAQGTFRGTEEVKIDLAEEAGREEGPRIVLSGDKKTITVSGLYPGDRISFDVALMDAEAEPGTEPGIEPGEDPEAGTETDPADGTETETGSDGETGEEPGTNAGPEAETGTETVSGSDIEEVTDPGAEEPSGPVVESTRAVELADGSRYYVKGLLKSGRDGSDALDAALPAEGVQEDLDYVVSYGIRGDMTSYRVYYRDAAGRELAPSRKYSGNVGDRPVAAYLYISGYQPQAYNLTKTLVRNEAENEMTFVYVPAREPGGSGGRRYETEGGAAGTGTGEGTVEIVETEETVVIPGGAADIVPDGDADGALQAGAGAEEVADEQVPLELLDLDDEETPLASPNADSPAGGWDKTNSGSGVMYALAAVAVTGLAVLIGFVLWFWKRRKKEEKA